MRSHPFRPVIHSLCAARLAHCRDIADGGRLQSVALKPHHDPAISTMKPRSTNSSGRGALRVKVKSTKGRGISSTRWLERQLNDPYVRAAKTKGYRSRAAFKLAELDDKFH